MYISKDLWGMSEEFHTIWFELEDLYYGIGRSNYAGIFTINFNGYELAPTWLNTKLQTESSELQTALNFAKLENVWGSHKFVLPKNLA